jgi:hypothetical protein
MHWCVVSLVAVVVEERLKKFKLGELIDKNCFLKCIKICTISQVIAVAKCVIIYGHILALYLILIHGITCRSTKLQSSQ